MKKISYSKDVDALLIEITNEPIAYAEDEGEVILHYSQDAKLVLVKILGVADFSYDLPTLRETSYIPDPSP